ncbi:MAG: hypothetical protein ACLULM_06570 [Acutalibacter sp.]
MFGSVRGGPGLGAGGLRRGESHRWGGKPAQLGLLPGESSQQESSVQAATPQPWQAEPSQGESASSAAEGALVLTQQDSGAEAGYEPTITLYPDGTFALFASFYDGSVTISGTYAQEGDGYVLTPTDSTAQGTAGSDVGEITLTPSGGGFAYSGGQLGATYDGAVFLPPQQ